MLGPAGESLHCTFHAPLARAVFRQCACMGQICVPGACVNSQGGLASRSSQPRRCLPVPAHPPTLVIARPRVRRLPERMPAARARHWAYLGRSCCRYYTVLELPCGSAGRGGLPGGQCPRRDRTCPIEDRREHDIDVELRLIVSNPAQRRPPPAYLIAYLHISSSLDATVL